ncbi:hypothetical protein [Woeseia oceani]|uniref:YdhG-like domain-containing protein n=1 Tax=Woeseia oceani TaxID=1548547 RepID=A0A193LCN7_9GAMM|nr:hypothetical protein [Woeseia oceani]ANO50300.1 hypothetical protein BA177_02875 [Woeseia oceani]
MTRASEFRECFHALRDILRPYARDLIVTHDSATNYSLDTKHIMQNKKPLFFAAVQIKKNYVSFHLMPVYVNPDLLCALSDNLKSRMHGKSCFNLQSHDKVLAAELAELVQAAYADYQRSGYA